MKDIDLSFIKISQNPGSKIFVCFFFKQEMNNQLCNFKCHR